jgi:thiol-disulfide isomerase/thioredoxin
MRLLVPSGNRTDQMLNQLRIALGLLILLMPTWASGEELIPWMTELEQAFAKAKQENKLVLIHFWHEQCAPCRRLESFVFKDGKIAAAIEQDYVAVKVNTRKQPEIAQRFKIKSVPQDLVYKPDGQILSQRISPSNSRGYMYMLSQVAQSTENSQSGVDVAVARALTTNDPSEIPVVESRDSTTPPPPSSAIRSSRSLGDQGQTEVNTIPVVGRGGPQSEVKPQVVHNPFIERQGNPPPVESSKPMGASETEPKTVAKVSYNPAAGEEAVSQPTATGGGAFRPEQATETQEASSKEDAEQKPQSNSLAVAEPGPQSAANTLPPLGLEGFCPIALIEDKEWKEGDRQFGCIHRGQLYLFLSLNARDQFMESPDRYAPILAGFDPVVFTENGELVAGSREHGRFIDDRIVLFTSEESFLKFKEEPMKYIKAVRQALLESEQVQR